MISSPHSPLFAGAEASSASARSANFRVAAETRGFLSFETEAWSDFVCPARAATKTPAGNTQNAKIIAIGNPTRTVQPSQITFRTCIVETANALRLAACVGASRRRRGWKAPRVAPRNLGTRTASPKFHRGDLMLKPILSSILALAIGLPLSAADNKKEAERLENCGVVLKEILDIPDDIPQDLLDKSVCVIVYPSVLKAAFVLGGSYGRGAMTCRTGEHFTGPWGAPTMMALEGGSIGFQIGGQATDFVLLVMNDRGAHAILKSKVKLGADASAAAGPKGRNAAAETDVTMRAEILTYSRARGLFAGISLAGSSVRPDHDANARVYGKKIEAEAIVFNGAVAVPPSAQKLIALLNQKSPKTK